MLTYRRTNRPPDITVAAFLMILFGLAEVRTAFTHTFFGISTTRGAVMMFASAIIGIFYALAGLLVLTVRRFAAAVTIVLLIADVAGWIALTATGLYPTGSLLNTVAIVAGTAIVAFFAIYIGVRWRVFA